MFNVLNQAAQAGGQVLRKYFHQQLKIVTKSDPTDLLTQADTESQEIIVNSLLSSMRLKGYREVEVGFIGEENSLVRLAPHTFIIDPLDGTSSFAAGHDTFAVSIAYMQDKMVQAGLVYDPMRDITYFAEKGRKAYRIIHGKKAEIVLSPVPFSDSMVALNTGPNRELARRAYLMAADLTQHVRRVREEHSSILTLMSLIEKRYHLGVVSKCKIWDIAAAKLILEEAGGEVLNWEGQPILYSLENPEIDYQVMAGCSELLKEGLKYVR